MSVIWIKISTRTRINKLGETELDICIAKVHLPFYLATILGLQEKSISRIFEVIFTTPSAFKLNIYLINVGF